MADYYKLSPEIFNAEADNLRKLAILFPSAVKDGCVDFTALREELGQFEEAGAERYELTWAGKQAAKKLSQTDVPGRTLKYVPEDSKDADTTGNLFIEGDNLEVLKLLRQNYYGAVKMIYIDPPYNTGNDFVYRDDFTISKAESDEAEGETVDGKRMVVNQMSGNRYHANWLNMMYPRLRVAKDLLREDGVIFISIDDNEVHNLRKLCDEVFSAENFVAQITVLNNPKGRSQDKHVATCHEFLLAYSKSMLSKGAVSIGKSEKQTESDYPLSDDNGAYRELELRNTHREFGKYNRPNLYYPFFVHKSGQVGLVPVENSIAVYPNWDDGFEGCWTWGRDKALAEASLLVAKQVKGIWKIYRKAYAVINGETVKKQVKSMWTEKQFHTEKGQLVFNELFSAKEKYFQSPKSVDLIRECVLMSQCADNDIILDFFSGSSTTAHAVMLLNAEDGGNRRFIMVQYPEVCDEKSEAYKAGYTNICEIGKERIRRAGEKILQQVTSGAGFSDGGGFGMGIEEGRKYFDVGFRVFRVSDTNIRWTHEAIMGQLEYDENMLSDKDRLDFMPGYTDIDVVYEVLLRQRDIPLSAKVEKLNISKRTYIFADAYIVYNVPIKLDTGLQKDNVPDIVKRKRKAGTAIWESENSQRSLKQNWYWRYCAGSAS